MFVKVNKAQGIELNGNVMSGNTFAAKDYIKAYLGGKWDATSKTWTVDPAKVERLLNNTALFCEDLNPPAPKNRDGFIVRKGVDGWCNKCHSYCYGDCDAN